MAGLLFNPIVVVIGLIGAFLYRYGMPGRQEVCGRRTTAEITNFEEVRLGSLLGRKSSAQIEDIADLVFLDWFATWLSDQRGVTKLVIGWDTFIDEEEVCQAVTIADRQFNGPIKVDPTIRTVGDFVRNLEVSITSPLYSPRLQEADRRRYLSQQ